MKSSSYQVYSSASACAFTNTTAESRIGILDNIWLPTVIILNSACVLVLAFYIARADVFKTFLTYLYGVYAVINLPTNNRII